MSCAKLLKIGLFCFGNQTVSIKKSNSRSEGPDRVRSQVSSSSPDEDAVELRFKTLNHQNLVTNEV